MGVEGRRRGERRGLRLPPLNRDHLCPSGNVYDRPLQLKIFNTYCSRGYRSRLVCLFYGRDFSEVGASSDLGPLAGLGAGGPFMGLRLVGEALGDLPQAGKSCCLTCSRGRASIEN
jgi:hypothetical protein